MTCLDGSVFISPSPWHLSTSAAAVVAAAADPSYSQCSHLTTVGVKALLIITWVNIIYYKTFTRQ